MFVFVIDFFSRFLLMVDTDVSEKVKQLGSFFYDSFLNAAVMHYSKCCKCPKIPLLKLS